MVWSALPPYRKRTRSSRVSRGGSKPSTGSLVATSLINAMALVQAHTPGERGAFAPVAMEATGETDSLAEGDGFEPSVPRGAARRCLARKRRQCEVARTSPPSRHDYRSNWSEASWVTTDPARLVVEIIGCRRSLQANSDRFSWRCRVARRPIRENAIRTQTGDTRGSP